ncbi:Uncharacterized protein TCM_027145 [Theobroma cacao]|uniref:Uncharacterized protein n=1 Tax=Theobroma cacao TaxID=3641 RepID=A0A061G9F3_THECC|nr:Uncharacterized protein TCM_027145 [Theobroma cacao]
MSSTSSFKFNFSETLQLKGIHLTSFKLLLAGASVILIATIIYFRCIRGRPRNNAEVDLDIDAGIELRTMN